MEQSFGTFGERFSKKLVGFDPAMIIAILMQILPILCPKPTPALAKAQAANPSFRLRTKFYGQCFQAGMSASQAKGALRASLDVVAESTDDEVNGFLLAAQAQGSDE